MRLVSWLALAAVLVAAPASAYPWMVRHNYGSCAACHVDPSGGGQLAPYGRAQSDVLLRWHLVKTRADEEASPTSNFLWFLELPEAVNLSGNVRAGAFIRPGSSAPVVPLIMATDLYATVNLSRFVGHVTFGPGLRRDGMSSVNDPLRAGIVPLCTPSQEKCGMVVLDAREFWVGVKFADDAVMVRAGRLNLPFGLRNNEHSSWVRNLTVTDINLDQQTGVSVAYNSEKLRGELMGILGNFQVGPDVYRERGYSAYAEYALQKNAYLGLSTLIARSGADPSTGLPQTRHAHGLFLRWAPAELVSILAEGEVLAWQTPSALDRIGFASLLQVDLEVIQGLHLQAMAEGMHLGDGSQGPSLGFWGTVAWYALPHFEVRLDTLYRLLRGTSAEPSGSLSFVLQLHFFL